MKELLHCLKKQEEDKKYEIKELQAKLGKCDTEMAAILAEKSKIEKSYNELLKEKCEKVIINLKKTKYNHGNHQSLLQGWLIILPRY